MRWVRAFAIAGAAFVIVVVMILGWDRGECMSTGYRMGMEARWGPFKGCKLKFPDTGWEKVRG